MIILSNSINHLNEYSTEHLADCQEAKSTYIEYFQKMFTLLEPGGTLIITDCDRRNMFNDLNLKSPFMPTIEWEKHQSPFLWAALLEIAGFKKISIKWSSPNSLGKTGDILFGNKVVAYFLFSHFRLEVQKPYME